MPKQKIKSIEKGWGKHSIYFTTDEKAIDRVSEIVQDVKRISSDTQITVYRGFKNGNTVFEMAANSDITLCFCE